MANVLVAQMFFFLFCFLMLNREYLRRRTKNVDDIQNYFRIPKLDRWVY